MDFTLLLFWSILLFGTVSVAAFDFYAFSTGSSSGYRQRSRNFAPFIVIGISFVLGVASGNLITLHNHELAAVEGLLLTVMMIASGTLLVRLHGLTGWLISTLGIVLSIGVASTLLNSSTFHYGTFEVCLGLLAGCSLLTYLTPLNWRPEHLPAIGVLAVTTIFLVVLNTSAFQFELALVGIASGCFFGTLLFSLRKIAGSHWKATSTYFLTGIGSLVVAGFLLHIAPGGFDSDIWAKEVNRQRRLLSSIILEADSDLALASQIEQARVRFRGLALKGQRASVRANRLNIQADQPDQKLLSDLELLDRMLAIIEKLHRARHKILEADRRTHAALRLASDPSQTDALHDFWQNQRPWIDSELLALRYDEDLGQERPHSREVLNFVHALNSDVERLTQVALDVELHRIDVWIDWASQQPSSMLPEMKTVASEQVIHLESLSNATKSLHHQPDPRLHSLHRNLRRMASVASHENW